MHIVWSFNLLLSGWLCNKNRDDDIKKDRNKRKLNIKIKIDPLAHKKIY